MKNPDLFFYIIQSSDKFIYVLDFYYNMHFKKFQSHIYKDLHNSILKHSYNMNLEEIIMGKKIDTKLVLKFIDGKIEENDLKGYL